MNRGAWGSRVHRVAKSWTRLKRLSLHACIFFFQVFFPYRLLQNIEYSSLGCTVGPFLKSILYIAVCICWPQLPIYPSFLPLPFGNHVCFWCVRLYPFFKIPLVNGIVWYLPFSVWLTSLSMIVSGSIHVATNGIISFAFMANIPLYKYTTSSLSICLLMDTLIASMSWYC